MPDFFVYLFGVLLFSAIGGFFYAMFRAARREHRVNTEQYRRSRRCCLTCGYNLQGTPERCPECGSPWKRPTASSPGDPVPERSGQDAAARRTVEPWEPRVLVHGTVDPIEAGLESGGRRVDPNEAVWRG